MKWLFTQRHSTYLGSKIALSLLMTVIFLLLYASNMFSSTEATMQDWLLQQEKETSSDIVVIGVTSHDLEQYGTWPWDRTTWVNVLSSINSDPETAPAAIGMTVSFYGWSQPISDEALMAELSKDNVILACSADIQAQAVAGNTVFSDQTQLFVSDVSYPYFYPSEDIQLGFTNILTDSDGVLRHALLSLDTPQGGTLNSMAYETFYTYNDYYGYGTDFTPELDDNGFWYVDYTAAAGGYLSYDISDILDGNYDPEDLAGKVVLIGLYDTTLMDYYRTSIDYSDNMYGIEFIANCINAMMNDVEVRDVDPLIEVVVLTVSIFLITFFSLYLTLPLVTILVIFTCAGGLGIITLSYKIGVVFSPFFFVVGLVSCFILSVAFNYWFEWYTKRHLTDIFRQYVDPKVLNTLVTNDLDTLHATSANNHIAVLFVDLRDFTRISEPLDAATVVDILNSFFTLVDNAIQNHAGTLDKFIGDCAMAFWGAPDEIEKPAYQACCAAMEMSRQSSALSAAIKEKYNVEISFGIGIHYGPAVVGNVGSNTRLDYTVIGDTVNTAARLEGAAPPRTIYISEAVAQQLDDLGKTTHLSEALQLKGKQRTVEVYILNDLEMLEAENEEGIRL